MKKVLYDCLYLFIYLFIYLVILGISIHHV